MKQRLETLLVVAVALLAVSCGNDGPTRANIDDTGNLPESETHWPTAGYNTYSYRFRWICFCWESLRRTVDIQVADGEVQRVTDAQTGAELDAESASPYGTIDSLFDFLEEAKDQHADAIRVTYDPTLGYPATAWVDYRKDLADEEMGFEIEWVHPR